MWPEFHPYRVDSRRSRQGPFMLPLRLEQPLKTTSPCPARRLPAEVPSRSRVRKGDSRSAIPTLHIPGRSICRSPCLGKSHPDGAALRTLPAQDQRPCRPKAILTSRDDQMRPPRAICRQRESVLSPAFPRPFRRNRDALRRQLTSGIHHPGGPELHPNGASFQSDGTCPAQPERRRPGPSQPQPYPSPEKTGERDSSSGFHSGQCAGIKRCGPHFTSGPTGMIGMLPAQECMPFEMPGPRTQQAQSSLPAPSKPGKTPSPAPATVLPTAVHAGDRIPRTSP